MLPAPFSSQTSILKCKKSQYSSYTLLLFRKIKLYKIIFVTTKNIGSALVIFIRWLVVITTSSSYSSIKNGNDAGDGWKDEHLCVETEVQEV